MATRTLNVQTHLRKLQSINDMPCMPQDHQPCQPSRKPNANPCRAQKLSNTLPGHPQALHHHACTQAQLLSSPTVAKPASAPAHTAGRMHPRRDCTLWTYRGADSLPQPSVRAACTPQDPPLLSNPQTSLVPSQTGRAARLGTITSEVFDVSDTYSHFIRASRGIASGNCRKERTT